MCQYLRLQNVNSKHDVVLFAEAEALTRIGQESTVDEEFRIVFVFPEGWHMMFSEYMTQPRPRKEVPLSLTRLQAPAFPGEK